MTSDELTDASETLREASDSIGDETGDRLREQAEAIRDLAERDRGPDHGRVARHQQKLKDLKADDPAAADAVDEANDRLDAYRETIEGV